MLKCLKKCFFYLKILKILKNKMSINLKFKNCLYYLDCYDFFGYDFFGYECNKINENMIINNPSFIYSRLTSIIEAFLYNKVLVECFVIIIFITLFMDFVLVIWL